MRVQPSPKKRKKHPWSPLSIQPIGQDSSSALVVEEKDVVVVWSDAIIPRVSEWERPLKRETINESCNILPPKESALSLECQLEISGIYEREGL